MQSDNFLLEFENCTLPKELFKHKDHLRMTWLYLSQYPIEQTLVRATDGIKRYANAVNAKELYHETLTHVWIYLVDEAMWQTDVATFDEFIAQNEYLLNKDLPYQYYSKSLLDGEIARTTWVAPDIKVFEMNLNNEEENCF